MTYSHFNFSYISQLRKVFGYIETTTKKWEKKQSLFRAIGSTHCVMFEKLFEIYYSMYEYNCNRNDCTHVARLPTMQLISSCTRDNRNNGLWVERIAWKKNVKWVECITHWPKATLNSLVIWVYANSYLV